MYLDQVLLERLLGTDEAQRIHAAGLQLTPGGPGVILPARSRRGLAQLVRPPSTANGSHWPDYYVIVPFGVTPPLDPVMASVEGQFIFHTRENGFVTGQRQGLPHDLVLWAGLAAWYLGKQGSGDGRNCLYFHPSYLRGIL